MGSPGSRAWRFRTCPGSLTARGPPTTRDNAAGGVAFRHLDSVGTPKLHISWLNSPACTCPCQRFADALTGRRRMTRGRRGSLPLRRRALPSPPPCRFIPALPQVHAGGGLNHLGVEAPTSGARRRGADAVPRGGTAHRGRRAGRVLPRRPAQGVRDRPGRAAGFLGVLRRHRRRPGQPGGCAELGVRADLRRRGTPPRSAAAPDPQRAVAAVGRPPRGQPQPSQRELGV